MDKKRNVPEIRFAGFTDDWEQRKLGEISTFLNGRAYKQEELLDKGKYPVLRVGNFNTNSQWYYSDLELDEKFYAHNGDLLYTWATLFAPYIWKGKTVIYHYHIWKIELSENFGKVFMLYCLEANSKKILNNTNGSTMIHITKEEIENKKLSFPTLPEQTAIGNFFKQLDETIALHQREYEKYKNLKISYLEKMFPKENEQFPELRFPEFTDAWEQRKLGEVLKIKSGMSQKGIEIENGIYPILATGGEIGRTNTALYNKESVLIGRKGTIDKPFYMNTPFWTVDTLFYSELSSYVTGQFIYTLFQKIKWRNFDTSTGVPSLTSSTIHNIEVKIPSLPEQTTIGNFFKQLDETIALHQRELEKYKKIKQSYLEKMFV